MVLKRKIISEYIHQIHEDIPGTFKDVRAENIIRGYDCEYLEIPRLETEPIICKQFNIETTPNCYCCWAKRRPYLKEFWRGNQLLKVCQ